MCVMCWNETLNGALGRCEMGIVQTFVLPIIRFAPPTTKKKVLLTLHQARSCVDAARDGYVLREHAADVVCELVGQVWDLNEQAIISMTASFPARVWGRA